MSTIIKAGIGTLFLAQTLGVMWLVMIWGVLTALHVNSFIVLTAETIGVLALLTVCVPLFRLIYKNERKLADPGTGSKAEPSRVD